MECKTSETSKKKTSLVYDGYTMRLHRTLKSGENSWRCTVGNCKGRVRTDPDNQSIVQIVNQHSHDSDVRKTEVHILRAQVKRKSDDISSRPSKILRVELNSTSENSLRAEDLKNVTRSIYYERRKDLPALPKSRLGVHNALEQMTVKTSKDEYFVLWNDPCTGVIIFSTGTNLECLASNVTELFIDGTFKCAPKFFYQMYSVHGMKNNNYIPLLFAILPSKTQQCYRQLWEAVLKLCTDRRLNLAPSVIHIDFEQAMITGVQSFFPSAVIQLCRFHLGQSWYRKILKVGLSKEYKDKDSKIGKWLISYFGLPFLDPEEVAECFAEDIMAFAPDDERCSIFADYVVDTYLWEDAPFTPNMWASKPTAHCKRTNNGPESFHGHFNAQFYSAHPHIFAFLDVLKKLQATTYVKIRSIDVIAKESKTDDRKNDMLLEYRQKLDNRDITRYEYVKAIGHKFMARTDM